MDWKAATKKTILQKEFLVAVSDNNVEQILGLINEGVDINFKDQDGYVPMFIAIEHANPATVKYLLDKGANLDILNVDNESPLDLAKRLNRTEIIKILEAASRTDVQIVDSIVKTESQNDNNNRQIILEAVSRSIVQIVDSIVKSESQNENNNQQIILEDDSRIDVKIVDSIVKTESQNENKNEQIILEAATRTDLQIVDCIIKTESQNENNNKQILEADSRSNLQIVNTLVETLSENEPKKFDNKIPKNKTYTLFNPVHRSMLQFKFLILFLYRAINQKYSFRFGTEIKDAKKIDVSVFEYRNEDSNYVHRIVHIKHEMDESRKITLDKLFTETNGDYSLIKLFHAFQSCKRDSLLKNGVIKDLIVCTNIDFDFDELSEANIKVYVVTGKEDIFDMTYNEKQSRKVKFTESIIAHLAARLNPQDAQISESDIKEFLEHLVFVVNQPDEDEIGYIMKSEVGKECDFMTTKYLYKKFFATISKWMREKGRFMSHMEGQDFLTTLIKSPCMWFNVQDPIKSFRGRQEEIKIIHEHMQSDENWMVCVSGFGGVGKSELVKRYIELFSECYDNQVVWINADGYQTIVNSFCQLANDRLDISATNADGKQKDVKTIISHVYNYFGQTKSLFVFDNAVRYKSSKDYDSGISRFLPSLQNDIRIRNPNIIITSRNKKWPENVKILMVDGFTKKESMAFISERLDFNMNNDKKDMKQLGVKLQWFPLALQQAVAYIKSQNKHLIDVKKPFKISQYLQKLAEKPDKITDFCISNQSDNKYCRVLVTTWIVALNAIRRSKNGEDAINLLNSIAYMSATGISVKILSIFIQHLDKLLGCIQLLEEYSLIQVENRMLSVHRLVQQVSRLRLVYEKEEETILDNCFKAMADNQCMFLNHFPSIYWHSRKYPELLKRNVSVIMNMASQLMSIGNCRLVNDVNAELIKVFEKLPAEDVQSQETLIRLLNDKGAALMVQGQFDEAFKELKKCYEADVALRGAYHDHSLLVKTTMASALQQSGKYQEALQCLQQTVKDCQVHLGEAHRQTIVAKTDLVRFLTQKEDYHEALLISQELCDKLTFLKDEPRYKQISLFVRIHMAKVLSCMDRLSEALDIYEPIYAEQREIYGENHWRTNATRQEIAEIISRQTDCKSTLQMTADLLDNASRTLGEQHPETVKLRQGYQMVLNNRGDNSTALKYLLELLPTYQRMYSDNHLDVLALRKNIAQVLIKLQMHAEASLILRDVLAREKQLLGDYHPSLELTLQYFATSLYRQAKTDESMKIHQELLRVQEHLYQAQDHRTLKARFCIAEYLAHDQKYTMALQQYMQIHEICKEAYGPSHDETMSVENTISKLHGSITDNSKFCTTLADAYKAHERRLGKYHPVCMNLRKENDKMLMDHQKMQKSHEKSQIQPTNNLFAALGNKLYDLLVQFIEEGGDVNAQNDDKASILYYAINSGTTKILTYLLKHNVDVRRATADNCTPLHQATWKRNLDLVKTLLDRVHRDDLKGYIDAQISSNGMTALHVAALNGSLDIAKYLLTRGATYDLKNHDKETAMDVADDGPVKELLLNIAKIFELVYNNNFDLIALLRQCNSEDYLVCANARDSQGLNLLQIIISRNQHHLAMRFLDEFQSERIAACIYTSPVAEENLEEIYSLEMNAFKVTRNQDYNIVQVLDELRLFVRKMMNYRHYNTNLSLSVIRDMMHIYDASFIKTDIANLVIHVITIHLMKMMSSMNLTLLLKSARTNDLYMLEKVAEKSVNINVTDNGGWTALHHATNIGNQRMVLVLLNNLARVDCFTNTGKFTPLHIAANKGYLKIAMLLLKYMRIREDMNEMASSAAVVDAKTDAKGSTALHVAVQTGQLAMVKALFLYEANYQIQNKNGQRPVDLINDNPKIRDFFELTDKLFADAAHGNDDLIKTLALMDIGDFVSLTSVRNDEGCNLDDLADANQHTHIAKKIYEMVLTRTKKIDVDKFFYLWAT